MKLRSVFVLSSISLAALAVVALPQSAHAQAVTVTTLANFDGTNGAFPYTALTLGRDGNFYGTTDGNPNNSSEVGTIFKLTPAGSLTTLFSFNGTGSSFPDGKNPNGLIQASDGNIYGTTARYGGANIQGTLFVITPAGALTTVHRFDVRASNGGVGDGELPSGIIQGRDGNLYGDTSFAAAPAAQGTLFRASTGGAFETLSYFTDPNVSSPHTALVQGSDGSFYGTTSGAGTGSNDGAVFKFTPGGGPETLVIFNGPNGYDPEAELIQATDGNFYGTTAYGGTNNSGTVFRMLRQGSSRRW